MKRLAVVDFTNVRTFGVKFVCNNIKAFGPECYLFRTPKKKKVEKRIPGTRIFHEAQKTHVTPLLHGTLYNGYKLVSARFESYKDRSNKNCMMQFWFAQKEHANMDADFLEKAACRCVNRLCEEALWQVNLYMNPFVVGDEAIPGVKSAMFNVNMREPLSVGGGTPLSAGATRQHVIRWCEPGTGKKAVRLMARQQAMAGST